MNKQTNEYTCCNDDNTKQIKTKNVNYFIMILQYSKNKRIPVQKFKSHKCLTLMYPTHFQDVQCQSGVNHN